MAEATAERRAGLDLYTFNELILGIHRISRDTPYAFFHIRMLQHIQKFLPFDSAWWGDASAQPEEILRLHLFNCDDAILQDYTPYMEQDFFRAALIAHPGRTINMSDLTTRARFVRTEMYRKVGKPYQIEWSLGTSVIEPMSSLYEFLTLWRHDPARPFTEIERQTKELLMPHLVQAHQTNLLETVLGGVKLRDSAWAIADDRGFLRKATPAFVRRLRIAWPSWAGSQLPAALLSNVAAGVGHTVDGLRVAVTAKGAYRYLEALAPSALDTLTPREREIARRFARGDTYLAIAQALSLASATVRNHLARCYRKLGVNNKSELTARLGQVQPLP